MQSVQDILRRNPQETSPAPATRRRGSAADAIRRIYEEEGVDPLIGLAMGQQEGGNWDTRTSGAGAQGPLQVIPSTGLRYVTPEEWETPEGKIRASARYAKVLAKQFNNDPYYIVGAYHAGEGKVRKYFKSGEPLPRSGEFYDRHANIYTPDHVNIVMRNYQRLGGQQRRQTSNIYGDNTITDILRRTPPDWQAGYTMEPPPAPTPAPEPYGPPVKTTLAPDPNQPGAPVDYRQALVAPVVAAQQQQAVNPLENRTILTPREDDSTLTAMGRTALAGLVSGGQRILKGATNLAEMAATPGNPVLGPAAGEAARAKLEMGERKLAGDVAAQQQAYGTPGTVFRRGVEMVTAGAPALLATMTGVPAPLAFGGQAAAENLDRGAERAATEGVKAGLTVGMMGKAREAITPLREGVLQSLASRLVAGGVVGTGAAAMELADQALTPDGQIDAQRAAEVGIPTAILTGLLPSARSAAPRTTTSQALERAPQPFRRGYDANAEIVRDLLPPGPTPGRPGGQPYEPPTTPAAPRSSGPPPRRLPPGPESVEAPAQPIEVPRNAQSIGDQASYQGRQVQITDSDPMVVRFRDLVTGQPGYAPKAQFEQSTGRPVAVQERTPRVETPSASEMPGGQLTRPQATAPSVREILEQGERANLDLKNASSQNQPKNANLDLENASSQIPPPSPQQPNKNEDWFDEKSPRPFHLQASDELQRVEAEIKQQHDYRDMLRENEREPFERKIADLEARRQYLDDIFRRGEKERLTPSRPSEPVISEDEYARREREALGAIQSDLVKTPDNIPSANQAPQQNTQTLVYNGSTAPNGELQPRGVPRTYNQLGSWFTSEKAAAEELYSKQGDKDLPVHAYQLPEGKLLKADTHDFNRFFARDLNLVRQHAGEKAAKTLREQLPDGARLRDLENKLNQAGSLQGKESQEYRRLLASDRVSRELLNNPAYMTAFQQSLKARGYQGIVWRESRIDGPKSVPQHDVYVIFHDQPLRPIESAPTKGENPQSAIRNLQSPDAPAGNKESDLLAAGWQKVDANRYTAPGLELVRDAGKWQLKKGKKTRRFGTLRDAISAILTAGKPAKRATKANPKTEELPVAPVAPVATDAPTPPARSARLEPANVEDVFDDVFDELFNQSKPTPAPSTPTTKEKWTLIGKNRKGEEIFEDERGARSILRRGVRHTEAVQMVPTRSGIVPVAKTDAQRKSTDYEVIEQSAPPAKSMTMDDIAKGLRDILAGSQPKGSSLDDVMPGKANVLAEVLQAAQQLYPNFRPAGKTMPEQIAALREIDVRTFDPLGEQTRARAGLHNEYLRTLANVFDEIAGELRDDAEGFRYSAPRYLADLAVLRTKIEKAARALRELGKLKEADFYATHAVKAVDAVARYVNEQRDAPDVQFAAAEPEFDQRKYAAMRPYFDAAMQNAATDDVRAAMKQLLSTLNKEHQFTPEMIQQLRPYIVRFVQDWQTGAMATETSPAAASQPAQPSPIANPKEGVKSNRDETDTLGTNPRGLSGRIEPGDVQAPQTTRGTGSGSQPRSQRGERPGIRSDEQSGRGDVVSQRAGDGATVRTTERPTRSGRRAGQPAGGDQSAPKTDARTVEQPPSAAHKPNDYVINDLDAVTPDGRAGKLRANLAAIRLYKQLLREGRGPTKDEQAELAKYTGFGQFGALFDEQGEPGQKLADERAELKQLLTSEEYEAARRSTLNAHYTDPRVIQAMWEMVRKLGFKSGRVLEPSMGIGHFLGLMPRELHANSRIVGIELDKTTGGMAKLLYPEARVQVKGFEEHKIADNFYDLVIGNVPFGDYKVHDPEYNRLHANIHDYFILKSIDKTRTGGLVAVITSTGTLDKGETRIREAMAKKADLVAAMRFPESTFEKSAGTSVVTDLLIFRKRAEGETANDAWVSLGKLPDADGGEDIAISNYFVEHPEMILGRLDRKSRLYRKGESHVSRTDDFAERFRKAIESLPADVMTPAAKKLTKEERNSRLSDKEENLTEGALVVKGGKVLRREGDGLVDAAFSVKDAQRATKILAVRDALRKLIDAQMAGADSKAARAELTKAYDSFVKQFGPLRKKTNADLLNGDPSAFLVQALEESYNPKTQKATKSAIFTRDVIARQKDPGRIETPGEAVAMSLFQDGFLDLDKIAGWLKTTPEAVGKQLVASGVAFESPRGGWETAEEYLSGNVRKKLIEAKSAADLDDKYAPNVTALEKVQPADIEVTEISARIGAPWIPASDIAEFAASLMETTPDSFRLAFVQSSGVWVADYAGNANYGTKATEQWGTKRVNFIKLLEAALNDTPVKVYDTVGSGKDQTRVLNADETDAANAKAQEIKDSFQDWLWTDAERTVRLHRYYNDNFNNLVVPQYKGEHYKNAEGKFILPGMNPMLELRPNQIKDVWQAVANGKLLDASEVGAGKTFIMGAIAMEWRRLGMAKKPAIAVPKSRLSPTVAELQLLYPAARILSFEKTFVSGKRKQTAALAATGDWDIVVLTHEQLDFMPMTPEVVQRFIRSELQELDERIKDAKDNQTAEDNKRGGSRVVKQLEKIKLRVETKLKEALDDSKKDDAVFFEETGIDALLVDEAHAFKSLPVYSRRAELKGVPTSRSERATNMFMRTQWLMEQNAGKGVVFATGTPVSNTLAELYNMQRYLQMDELKERGIDTFDAWADVFTEATTNFEYKATGEYAPVTRLTNFVNLPELQQMVRQLMATNFVEDMPWIKRPRKNEEVISTPMSAEQKAYLQTIRERAERLKKMSRQERKFSKDNFLLLSTDARKSAMSTRLVNPHNQSDDGKVKMLVEKVLEIHQAHPTQAQMIFSDMGVNETPWGYSVYDDVIARLVNAGIPREKIANFSTMTDKRRQEAADKLNEGKYLIGIGSSWKMGTGVNAQKRLVAMHHLDVAWVPAYLEQRNGRGHRQGNQNAEVQVYYYVTEDSFDLVMWQAVARKWKAISQFMRGGIERVIKMDDTGDEDSGELSPEMIMAATSGNPFELDRVKAQQDIQRLERQQRTHRAQQSRLIASIGSNERRIKAEQLTIADFQKFADQYQATKGEKFKAYVQGRGYDQREEAGQAVLELATGMESGDKLDLGKYRGFNLKLRVPKGWTEVQLGVSLPDVDETLTLTLAKYSANSLFQAIDQNLRQYDGYIAARERQISYLENEISESRKLIGQPFKNQAKLDAVKAKLETINQQIKEHDEQRKQREQAAKRVPARPQYTNLRNGGVFLQRGSAEPQFQRAPQGWENAETQSEQSPSDLIPDDWKTASKGITRESHIREIIPAVRSFYRPADARVSKGIVVGNKAASLALMKAYRKMGGKAELEIGGMTLRRADADRFIDVLRAFAASGVVGAEKVQDLADAFEQAAAVSGTVFYVDADPSRTKDAVEAVILHEVELHGWQSDTNAANLGLVSDDWMRNDRDYQQIVRHLTRIGYKNVRQKAAIEAIAYIGSGEWEKVGYTGPNGQQRAAAFAERYLREVVREYGPFALKRLRLHPAVQSVKENVLNEQQDGRADSTRNANGRLDGRDRRIRETSDSPVETRGSSQGVGDRLRGRISDGRGTGSQTSDSRPSGEREAVELVPLEPAFASVREVFGVDDIKGTLAEIRQWSRESMSDIRSVVNPMGRGISAQETASIVRERAAELARKTDQAEAKFKTGRQLLLKLSWPQRRGFLYAIETGSVAQLPPELQTLASQIRQVLDERRDEVQRLGTGKLQSYYENYFPHIWKDPKKANQVFNEYFGKRPFQGSKSFLKQRTVPTIEHGIALGLEPVSQDPIELLMLKLREMDRYIMAHLVMQEMQNKGLLVRIKAGHRVPDGYGKIDDSVGTIFGAPVNGALTIRGYWIGPEPAVNVLNNYLSQGLRQFAPFRGYLALANAMNQFQLGFSAFHLGFTSLDAAISRTALGLHEISHGSPWQGVRSILSTPVSPITNILKGRKVYKAWEAPGSMGPEWDAIANAVQAGGGRTRMDSFYATQITKKMKEAFARKNVPGVAAGLFRVPFAVVEQASRPIMEYIVPRQKLGVFADLARFELERLGPNPSHEDVRKVMAKAWDSVDNRMGQLVYDNLFWHKTFKDLLMASIRSVGWNLGTKREVAGGVLDFAKFATNVGAGVVRGAGGGGRIPPRPPRVAGGDGAWFSGNPEFTYRMEYVIAMTLVVGSLGALLNYLFTGKHPQELKDYFFPQTGNTDENGRPERLSLPAYIKDIYHYAHDAKRTALNKLHPALNLLGEIWSNRDFYGTEIWNEDDPPSEKAQEVLTHVAKSFQPFAYRGMIEERERGSDWSRSALPFIGLTPAPSSINKTKAENLMDELARERRPIGTRTKEQAELAKFRRDTVRNLRRGTDQGSTLKESVAAGKVSERQAHEILRRAATSPLEYQFNHLGLDDALRVWEVATPAERQKLKPLLKRKAQNALESQPAAVIQPLMPKLREIFPR